MSENSGEMATGAMDDSEARDEAVSIACADAIHQPGRLGPIELRNRIIKCATNEGLSRGGLITDELIEWHRRIAAGGVGMTTLAYCSVEAIGRTFKDQIWMRREALPGLRRFTDSIHAEGAAAAIQLGHAGWFASAKAIGGRPVGPSTQFSPHGQSISRAMDTDQMQKTEDAFVLAAKLAVDAGFDGIEVHVGHGYLLSQFLCPYNNRRKDEHGGSLENRARYPRRILNAIREAVGDRAAIWAKLNMEDGFADGLSLDHGIEVARMLEADDSVDALQLTGGHTLRTPMFLMRGDVPLKEMVAYEPDPVRRFGIRILGSFLIKPYPFEEAFFLEHARRFKAAVDLPVILLGGLNERDTMNAAVREGFPFLALGRALIRDPDFVDQLAAGSLDTSRCDHCNKCVAEMELPTGTRCVYWPEGGPVVPTRASS
jgi:2,4-dienoyl-CoA reductase-like NADH-dependent reductase (Old Yellow Enzyme family)